MMSAVSYLFWLSMQSGISFWRCNGGMNLNNENVQKDSVRNIVKEWHGSLAKVATEKNTVHNGLERYDKIVYSEISVRQKVSRRSVLTAKCPHGEMSLRRSIRTAKCQYGEKYYGEMSHGEKSYGKKSGHGER